ncbi:serine hydrolase domain-containing protein [Caulobacter vibrioides]|nr:serine hydrolase domain-containing protein [Caulobacter vibrioides]
MQIGCREPKGRRMRLILVAGMALSLLGCGDRSDAASVADPELTAVLARWDQDDKADLKAVVVMRDGQVVAERYFNGETDKTLHDVRSAGKSVTALLATIAVDRGLISSLADPVKTYWPQAATSAIGDVRLDDVLTMRSGLAAFDADTPSPGDEDRLDEAADPVAFTLGVPRAHTPGVHYRYNSLTAYVAGLVIEKAAGRPMSRFADETLFKPLGIDVWRWDADVAGHTKGQGNLWLTARDLATLGELVRARGVYRGHRIVSEAGVDAMLQPRLQIPPEADDPYADAYGYFWYAKTYDIGSRKVPIRFASGNGGNKIYIAPDQRLVVAITSSAYGRGYGQRRSEAILKAILEVESR